MIAPIVWFMVACTTIAPILIAASSPLLDGREGVYIAGGMAGIVAFSLLLLQPLLASGYLPGLNRSNSRRWHRLIGITLFTTVAIHIVGLYLTSPDDLTDALLLVAPTPFSVYGVVGMWTLVLTTILVSARSRIALGATAWKIIHNALAVIVVVCSVIHTLMIDGAMGYRSKIILSICILAATAIVVLYFRIFKSWLNRRVR